jgi:hypothetical protein
MVSVVAVAVVVVVAAASSLASPPRGYMALSSAMHFGGRHRHLLPRHTTSYHLLTAMGIHGVIFCRGPLVVSTVIFRHATPLLIICRITTTMHHEHNKQPKEGCAAKICLTAAIDDGSVSGNNGKDASATTAMMPVQRGHWYGHNNGKDASNRGNVLCNNQPAQQKDKRGDKRSGVEDMTPLQRGVQGRRLFLVTAAGGGKRGG